MVGVTTLVRKKWADGVYCSTGQVSRMLNIAPRTVSKLFDLGAFPGSYRMPSSSRTPGQPGNRKIPFQAVLSLCRDKGLPIPGELKWLTVGIDLNGHSGDYVAVEGFEEPFSLGCQVAVGEYGAVVLNSTTLPLATCKAVAAEMKLRTGGRCVTALIATEDSSPESIVRSGDALKFDLLFPHGTGPREIGDKILKSLNPNREFQWPRENQNGTAGVVATSSADPSSP